MTENEQGVNLEKPNFIDAQEIFEQIIHPGGSVLSIGPNSSYEYDPTARFVAYLLGENGELYIVDSDERTAKNYRDELSIASKDIPLAVPELKLLTESPR